MSGPHAVVDASAIVALVMRERGGDVIHTLLSARHVVTTPTGLAEAIIGCRRKGFRGTRDGLARDLGEFGLHVEPLVGSDALEMAFLLERSDELGARQKSKSGKVGRLSLGDVACLAVARRLGVPAIVSDGTWEILDVPGLKVMPFR